MTFLDMFETALEDAKIAVFKRNWIEIKTDYEKRVTLDYGPIHSNGMFEQAICTITYELRGQAILRNKQVHT